MFSSRRPNPSLTMPQFHQGDPLAKIFVGRVHYDLEEAGIREEISKWNQPIKYIWIPGKRGSCHVEFESRKAKEAFVADPTLHYMAGRRVDVKEFDARMIQHASTVEPIKVTQKKKVNTSLGLASIQQRSTSTKALSQPAPPPATNAWASGRPNGVGAPSQRPRRLHFGDQVDVVLARSGDGDRVSASKCHRRLVMNG